MNRSTMAMLVWKFLFPEKEAANQKKLSESLTVQSSLHAFGSGCLLGTSVPLLISPSSVTPDSSLHTARGTGLFSLASHVLVPASIRFTTVEPPTVDSSILSVLAGSLIGLGSSFLFCPLESRWNRLKRLLGGAGTVFGLYVWAPAELRVIWSSSKALPLLPALQLSALPLAKGAVIGALLHYVFRGVSPFDIFTMANSSDNDATAKKDGPPVDSTSLIPSPLRGVIGGACLSLGIFYWSPPFIRSWMM